MRKISALLVDDEISALRTLRGMLSSYCPEVEVVAVASSVKEALGNAKKFTPELVFLDIEMPPFGSGFDFIEQSKDLNFGVIFTTAYPEYAIKAINKVQPWAYLVKPFSADQLRKAVRVAQEKNASAQDISGSIVVPDFRNRSRVIRLAELYYCKADSGAIEVYFMENEEMKRCVVTKTLKEFSNDLNNGTFFRCHHSYLVNMSLVERYEKTGRNAILHLKNGTEIPVSIAKKEQFEKKFSDYLKG